ncbi:HTH-type transcriptional activator RhaS [Marinomonas spartinae]|nr:HTH-type transcriptional activator RhaS [Marinomonas spartinae]
MVCFNKPVKYGVLYNYNTILDFDNTNRRVVLIGLPLLKAYCHTNGLEQCGIIMKRLNHVIQYYESRQTTQSHEHSVYQWFYVHEGSGIISTEDGGFLLLTGQLVYIPAYVSHEFIALKNSCLSLIFSGEDVATPPIQSIGLLASHTLWTQLMAYLRHNQPHLTQALWQHYDAILLDQLARFTPLQGYRLSSGCVDPRLLNVIESLSHSVSIKTSLASVSQQSGASERTLNRLFAEQLNTTYQAFRYQLVMQKAQQAYEQGESVTNIAFDLGYKSLSAFSRAFLNYQKSMKSC